MPPWVPISFACASVASLVATEVIRHLHWKRHRASGFVPGTQHVASLGSLAAALFTVAALVTYFLRDKGDRGGNKASSHSHSLSGHSPELLPEIDDKLQGRLDRLAAEGDDLAKAGKHQEAIAVYKRGFDLIPPPREGRSASLWFISAIGDAQWFAKDYTASLDTWRDAIILYGGFGNPFVHLRRGQTLFELGQKKEAANELLRALLLGGEAVFKTEHRKYWTFITMEARPPEGYSSWVGWPGLSPDSPLYHRMMNPDGVYQFSKEK
jgi:tetratricopeptide (TPR) repeat protein